MMHGRTPLIAVTVLMLLLIGTVLGVAGAGGTKIVANPASVAAGATTRIDGTGFSAGSSGQITWDGSASGMPT